MKKLAAVRVLLIEDHADARELLALMLTRQGAEVIGASSAEEAVSVYAESTFDVIVSDIAMPGLSGWDFIERLRAHEDPARRCPAIAVSGNATADDTQRSLAAGFDRHLSKPVHPRALVAAVAELLGR